LGQFLAPDQRSSQEWNDITVNVAADRIVESSYKLTVEKNGFQRLDITLLNNGTETVTIEGIEIRIPFSEPVAQDMKVAYGSSCMGQRPVFVHQVGEPTEK
jgi:hypothetical protein